MGKKKKNIPLEVSPLAIDKIPPDTDASEKNPYTTVDCDFTVFKHKKSNKYPTSFKIRVEFIFHVDDSVPNTTSIYVQDNLVTSIMIKRGVTANDILTKMRDISITICKPDEFFTKRLVNNFLVTLSHGNIFIAGDISGLSSLQQTDGCGSSNDLIYPGITIDKTGDTYLIPTALYYYLSKTM